MKCINILKDDQYEFKGITHNRKIARGILINDKKEICLLHVVTIDDFGNRNYYETPGGGVNEDEDINKAIVREIKEETGFNSEIICEIGYVEDDYNLIYRHNINCYFLLKATSFEKEMLEEYEKKVIQEKVWVSIDKAIELYNKMGKEKIEILVKRRELPILLIAKKLLEEL